MRFIVAIVPSVIGGSLSVGSEVDLIPRSSPLVAHPTGVLMGHTWCPPASFRLEGDGREIHRGPLVAEGGFGLVYRSTDGLLALKVPRIEAIKNGSKETLPREMSILDYIKATGGIDFIPQIHHVDAQTVPDECARYLIVIDWVGPFPLQYLMSSSGALVTDHKDEFKRISIRLIEMVESLYTIRLSHGDLYASNMVLSDLNNISGTLKMIDFGEAQLFTEIEQEERTMERF